MMVTASAVGSMVLLLVWGIAHSQVGTTTAFPSNPRAVTLLVAGTIGHGGAACSGVRRHHRPTLGSGAGPIGFRTCDCSE
ncbi:MAG: hypothetical protein WKF83_06460 [Nocardioidaceae bacterium]